MKACGRHVLIPELITSHSTNQAGDDHGQVSKDGPESSAQGQSGNKENVNQQQGRRDRPIYVSREEYWTNQVLGLLDRVLKVNVGTTLTGCLLTGSNAEWLRCGLYPTDSNCKASEAEFKDLALRRSSCIQA